MKTFNKSTLAAAVGTATLALAMSGQAQAESSVTLSGWINEGLTYFDDGDNSDVVQTSDNGTTLGSRITFSGSTDLANTGMNAGFEVILEPLSTNTPLIFSNQDGATASGQRFDDNLGADIGVLGSSVNVGGPFGKFTVGLQSMPTDNIAVLADPSLTLWPSISPVFRGNGFSIKGTEGSGGPGVAGEQVWGQFLNCYTAPELQGAGGIGIDCNGIYRNGVRYDLPTFVDGLGIAVGYANDDIYDVAAKYNIELAGRLNTILHAGYATNQGPSTGGNAGGVFYDEADNIQVQLGLMDAPTGLFGTLAYQRETVDGEVAGFEDSTDAWWGKVGIKRSFTAVGDTAVAFQYGQYNDQHGALGVTSGITGSEVRRLGVEVSQYFGSDLIIYGVWERLDLDGVDGPGSAAFAGAEELDTVTLGLTYFF